MTESLLWRAALIAGAGATTAFLTEGMALVSRPGWHVFDAAPAWTCLASGTERLLKLTIGLTAIADGHPWPTERIRHLYGHRLERLRPDVDRELAQRVTQAANEPYVRSLVRLVEHDPCLPDLFAALALWADSPGRYRHLEILGGRSPLDLPMDPVEPWELAERKVMASRPSQERDPGQAGGQPITDVRKELVGSLLRWWFLHYRAWAHGVFGPVARQCASEVDPRRAGAISGLAEDWLNGL